jgi:hypothetical protein
MWPFKKNPPKPPGKWEITSDEAISKYGSAINAIQEWRKDNGLKPTFFGPYALFVKAIFEIIDILKKDGKI